MLNVEQDVVERIQGKGVAAAYFGSRARNAQQEHSDYDVILISHKENEGDFYFVPEDNVSEATSRVCIFYRTEAQSFKSLQKVDEDWPVRNAPFIYNSVIFDEPSIFEKLKQNKSIINPQAFDVGFHETMYHAFEYLGKIKNNVAPYRTLEAARRFGDKLCRAVAIKNQHVFRDYCDVVAETKSLPVVPEVFSKNIEGIVGFKNWDIKEIQEASVDTWKEYLSLKF